jgi:tetratricopeptide (TPR) repeat protein
MKAESHLARAEAALEIDRYDVAITEAGLAIASDPESDYAFYVLARALSGAGRRKEALAAVDTAIARDPECGAYFVTRSDILRGLIEYDLAMQAAEESMRLDPQALGSYYAIGLSANALDQHDRAIDAYTRALELVPGYGPTHRFLADVYLDRKQWTKAEEHYRVALKSNPNEAATLNNLGCALLGRSKKREAALAFKAALLLDPTMSEAKENTHSTVSALIGRGGAIGLGVGGVAAAKTCAATGAKAGYFWFAIARHLSNPQTWIWLCVAAVAITGFIFGKRKWNEKALRKADPQIIAIFDQLQADKKAGRI